MSDNKQRWVFDEVDPGDEPAVRLNPDEKNPYACDASLCIRDGILIVYVPQSGDGVKIPLDILSRLLTNVAVATTKTQHDRAVAALRKIHDMFPMLVEAKDELRQVLEETVLRSDGSIGEAGLRQLTTIQKKASDLLISLLFFPMPKAVNDAPRRR